jgi:hypothetical protein
VDLVQNKVEVSDYQSIVLRLQARLSEASIVEGARDFSHVKNVFTRSGSHAVLCSRGTESTFPWGLSGWGTRLNTYL